MRGSVPLGLLSGGPGACRRRFGDRLRLQCLADHPVVLSEGKPERGHILAQLAQLGIAGVKLAGEIVQLAIARLQRAIDVGALVTEEATTKGWRRARLRLLLADFALAHPAASIGAPS